MKTTALISILLTATAASAQEPTTGYAPANGLEMHFEVHGKGDPVVLRHGSLMELDVIVPMVNAFLDAPAAGAPGQGSSRE